MKINKPKRVTKKRLIIAIMAIVLLLAGSLGTYLYAYKGTLFGWSPIPKSVSDTKTSTINYDKPTDEQKKAGESIKEQSLDDKTKPNSSSEDNPADPVSQSNGKGVVDVTITSVSTTRIGTLIGAITNSGTCTLTLTKDSTVITKTSKVQALAHSSTCQGFDVDLSTGTWQISLHFENDTLQGDTKQSKSL